MIHVIDDIYIDATRDCYIVGIPKKRKDGTTFLSSPKYYSSLENAIRSVPDRVLHKGIENGSLTDLNDVVDSLKKIKQDIVSNISEVYE